MRRSRPRRALAAVLLAGLLLLAGCTGAGGGGNAASDDYGATKEVERAAEEAPVESGGAAGSGDGALRIEQRRVIKTGRVVLSVDDYGRARRNLTRAVRGMDGFVSDSTRRRHEVEAGTYVTGSVTLRVPDERFGAMMDRAESMGTVEHSETSSKDVTDQLVDIEARLTNLRRQRERLRTLYERANDTEAVLAVQRRLSETQERIERLEAKQRSLERRVAYSTITVELNEPRPEPGPDEIQQWYDVPLVGAFLESVHGVTVVARALAVLAAYALPYVLAVLGPVGLVGGLAVRRYRRGRDAGSDGSGGAGDGTDDDGPDRRESGPDHGGPDDAADDGPDGDAAGAPDDGGSDSGEDAPDAADGRADDGGGGDAHDDGAAEDAADPDGERGE